MTYKAFLKNLTRKVYFILKNYNKQKSIFLILFLSKTLLFYIYYLCNKSLKNNKKKMI